VPPYAGNSNDNTLRRLQSLCCAALLALVAAGCPEPDAPPADVLTIAYIGNYRGFQRPCGCVARQDGGLLRLEAVLEHVRSAAAGNAVELPQDAGDPPPAGVLAVPQELALLDCGNFTQAGAPLAAVRSRTHLDVLKTLGAAAAVVGGEELALSPADAEAAFGAAPVTLLTCNATSRSAAIKLQPTLDLGGGWTLIGISVPKAGYDAESGWATLGDPYDSVQRTVEALPAGTRVIVAGAQLAPALCERLGTLGLAAIIGASSEVAALETPVFPAPLYRGQRLLFASLQLQGDGIQSTAWGLNVSPGWPDSEAVLAVLRGGEERQRQALRVDPSAWRETEWGMADAYQPAAAAAVADAGPRYAGAATCLECHAEDHAVLEQSRHRSSYMTLLEHQEAQTLDCLSCHVTGLFKPGGYDPMHSPDVLKDPTAFVGCESCHGPASEHVRLARLGEGDLRRGVERSSIVSCLQCHDEYNSPQFDADEYWDQIRH
jgi:hypothetical protein